MNDRGLSLSPTDMLKGYLLANITDSMEKAQANEIWKKRLLELIGLGKEGKEDESEGRQDGGNIRWYVAVLSESLE